MTDHQQAALEAVKAELDSQEAMHCTRVWEAWRYGTMTEEDFVNASEDDQCVQALIAAAEPHLRRKWAEELERAMFKVESVHHFGFGEYGIKCLCGFESSRSRSRTEHITQAVRGLLEGAGE